MRLTSVVYQSSNVEIVLEDDFYSIKATKDLPIGHLVLIEHVLWGSYDYVTKGVARDSNLLDTLFPRTIAASPKNNVFEEKTKMNCFSFDGVTVMGNVISKFNHSCVPNCHLDILDFIGENKFYGTWTHRNVKAGEELTFDYVNKGDTEFHKDMKELHNFPCNCSAEDIEMNGKRAKVRLNMSAVFGDRDRKKINQMVDNYLRCGRGIIVSKSQKAFRKACSK